MLFAESQLRATMLEIGTEVFVAATLAETIKGAAYNSTANLGDEVQIEGTATPAHWNRIVEDMRHIPEHIATIEATPTEAGNYEFSLTVKNERLEDHETQELVGFLRERWGVRIPYTETFVNE